MDELERLRKQRDAWESLSITASSALQGMCVYTMLLGLLGVGVALYTDTSHSAFVGICYLVGGLIALLLVNRFIVRPLENQVEQIYHKIDEYLDLS